MIIHRSTLSISALSVPTRRLTAAHVVGALFVALWACGAIACGGSEITGQLAPDEDSSDVIDDDDATTADGDDDDDDAVMPGPDADDDASGGTGDAGPSDDAADTDPDGSGEGDGGATADADPSDGKDSAPDSDAGAADDDAGADIEEVDDGPECATDDDCPAVACQEVSCDTLTGECVGEPVLDGLACDDGNACSVFDACLGGVCAGGEAIDCDDDNPCTDDLCSPATGCDHKSNFAFCDDGDPCTAGDACTAGTCVAGPPKCDDGNECTVDNCVPGSGECFNTADDSLPCDDGSDCTLGDACSSGVCIPGPGPGCDDGNDCTLDTCDDDLCKHIALHGDACDDGDVCTVDDQCALGECEPGPFQPCDDLNSCTVDDCIPGVGCDHVPTPGEPCDDDDACTTVDDCNDQAACIGSTPLDCNDDNICTNDECHPVNACVYVVATGPCDDDNACTSDDECAGGECTGATVSCDDSDVCTADSCDPKLGCEHTPTDAECDDGDVCTHDSCDAIDGCVNAPNEAPCDDEQLCTEVDICSGGDCAGVPVDCDDDDQCTIDACDPEAGCVHENHHEPCDDDDACTEGTSCDDLGACTGGGAVNIDDGLDCTLDGCTAEGGVTHVPDDDLCGPGRVCDANEGCVMGDVHIVITKLSLLPAIPGPADDSGQWLALVNVGEETVDLRGYRLVNGAGLEAPLLAVSGDADDQLLLDAGVKVAGLEAPDGLPSTATDGWDFVFGAAADGFFVDPSGDTLSLVDENGDVADLLDISTVTLGPTVGTNGFPAIPGAPTELDATSAAVADEETDNDPVGLWCVWPSESDEPSGEQLSCSRARLNEVSLAGADGARFIELHLPAGGPLAGLELRLYDADGASAGTYDLPSARMPIGAASVVTDGVDGASLPPLTDGSVHLHRFGTLVDVYGFGTLNVAVDQVDGHPMAEGTAGPAQVDGLSAERAVDGADSDDNATDWQQVDAGSPGALNAD